MLLLWPSTLYLCAESSGRYAVRVCVPVAGPAAVAAVSGSVAVVAALLYIYA